MDFAGKVLLIIIQNGRLKTSLYYFQSKKTTDKQKKDALKTSFKLLNLMIKQLKTLFHIVVFFNLF